MDAVERCPYFEGVEVDDLVLTAGGDDALVGLKNFGSIMDKPVSMLVDWFSDQHNYDIDSKSFSIMDMSVKPHEAEYDFYKLVCTRDGIQMDVKELMQHLLHPVSSVKMSKVASVKKERGENVDKTMFDILQHRFSYLYLPIQED